MSNKTSPVLKAALLNQLQDAIKFSFIEHNRSYDRSFDTVTNEIMNGDPYKARLYINDILTGKDVDTKR